MLPVCLQQPGWPKETLGTHALSHGFPGLSQNCPWWQPLPRGGEQSLSTAPDPHTEPVPVPALPPLLCYVTSGTPSLAESMSPEGKSLPGLALPCLGILAGATPETPLWEPLWSSSFLGVFH